jgi:hypothetical protein
MMQTDDVDSGIGKARGDLRGVRRFCVVSSSFFRVVPARAVRARCQRDVPRVRPED